MSVWRDTPTLAGRHVVLRPLDPADLPALVDAARTDGLWDTFYANVAELKRADAIWRRPFPRAMTGAGPTAVSSWRPPTTDPMMRFSLNGF